MPQAIYGDLRHATGFLQRYAAFYYRNLFINVNFSKIVAFKGTIIKVLEVEVHFEGLRNPSICLLFDTLFRVSVSLR
jgi:hypothetical protein